MTSETMAEMRTAAEGSKSVSSADVLALLDALEAAQKRIAALEAVVTEMRAPWFKTC